MAATQDATDLAFAGAAEQARRVAAGEVSAREVVEATLERIADQQPRVNAFRVVLAEQALAAADAADARRARGEGGLLNGVPVAIKDDHDVAGQSTPRGTAADLRVRERDSDVVARLRAAGAVIVGKTHVPELTMNPATDSVTYGATRNPWDLSRTPGGSSGGSGAAMAAGLAGVALGTDGAGSIRTPSAWCGLFGIKPQLERIPFGTPDAWQGLAHAGPMARTVADAALFLDATATDVPPDGFAAAARREPGRLRIAVSTKVPPGATARLGQEERVAVERAAALLRELGHDVVERDPDYPLSLWSSLYTRVLRGIADDAAALPHPELLERRSKAVVRIGRSIPGAVVARARRDAAAQTARILSIFDDVDVVLLPTCADGPYRAGEFTRHGVAWWLAFASQRLAFLPAFNLTGTPACTVPAGQDADGLPVGVQLAGRPHDEATLLSLAAQMETARPWAARRPADR
jgi:amidase